MRAPHLLRRLLAFLIDQIAAWALVGLVSALIAAPPGHLDQPDSDKVSVALNLSWSGAEFRPAMQLVRLTCYPWENTRFPALASVILPNGVAGTVAAHQACDTFLFGVFIGTSDVTTLTLEPGGTTVIASPPFRQTSPFGSVDLLVALGFLCMSWACLTLFGSTPGKLICGLRVQGSAQAKLLREVIRLSPVLLALLATATFSVDVMAPLTVHLGSITLAGTLFGITAKLAFWVYPVMRGQALMPWDRIAGTSTIRR